MPYIDKEDREIVEFGSELAGMSGLTRFIEMLGATSQQISK